MKRWWLYLIMQELAGLLFKMMNLVSRVTFRRLFFTIEARGLENIPEQKSAIIITPNHKSYVDHFYILAVLPFFSNLLPARSLAADWLFTIKVPVLGFLVRNGLRAMGSYPTRRGSGLTISLRDPLRVLKSGGTVCIYPEGGIRYRRGVHEVKIGAVYLAHKSGTKILPIAIRGLEYLTWKAFFFSRRRVVVIFGKPFHVKLADNFDELSKERRAAALQDDSELLRLKITELYEEKTA